MSLTKKNIQKYLKEKNTSYRIFDIKYKEKEKQIIDNFKINNELIFSYCGKFNRNTLLKGDYYSKGKKSIIDILKFISNIGNNIDKDIHIIKDIIYRLLDKITKGYSKDYICLEIRIFLPNKDFNISRWHFDGFENQSKFVTLLKGPSTLFINDNDIESKNKFFETTDKMFKEQKEYIDKNGMKINEILEIDDKYRKILAKKLKDAKIVQPNNHQGTIFLTDSPKNNNNLVGIHSEPINNKPRFFISVMCGNKEEIKIIKKSDY
jgi:hypothetical protein